MSFIKPRFKLPSRCISGCTPHRIAPPSLWRVPQEYSSAMANVPGSSKYSYDHNALDKPIFSFSSLLHQIDRVILPMSPAEHLVRFQLPTVTKHESLEMPTTKASLDNAHINQKVIEIQAPQKGKVIEQLAIRMLVVRRRKMKRHQRKKYLKKFSNFLMTRYNKREAKKEIMFFSELEKNLKEAEAFSAKEYAASKIRKAYEPLPEKEVFGKPLPWEFQPLFYNSQKKSGK